MKAYRLHNLTELGPAAPLHFLERAGAEGYRDYVLWPYKKTGRFPLHAGGSVKLDDVDLRVEEIDLNAVLVPELELLLLERNGLIGTCYVLPGKCYDPDSWVPANATELGNPQAGPLLEEAQRRLKQDAGLEERAKLRDPRWHN